MSIRILCKWAVSNSCSNPYRQKLDSFCLCFYNIYKYGAKAYSSLTFPFSLRYSKFWTWLGVLILLFLPKNTQVEKNHWLRSVSPKYETKENGGETSCCCPLYVFYIPYYLLFCAVYASSAGDISDLKYNYIDKDKDNYIGLCALHSFNKTQKIVDSVFYRFHFIVYLN